MSLIRDTGVYRFHGKLRYVAILNRSSGRRGRYDLLILNADDPVTAGREIPLSLCNELVEEYEELADPHWLCGRTHLLTLLKKVSAARLKRYGKTK